MSNSALATMIVDEFSSDTLYTLGNDPRTHGCA